MTGEIDLSNVRILRAAITDNVPDATAVVILDLGAVRYLDSTGIELVVALRESMMARGQDLRLVVPSGSPADDALRLAGVVDQLPTAETLERARSGPD